MKITLAKIDGLYDIQPLPAAALSNAEWMLLFIAFSIIGSLFFYFTWKTIFSKRNRARRKIRQLQKNYTENRISAHDTAYRLSYLLRYGLGLTCLTQQTSLPEKIATQQTRWAGFTGKLDQLRYQKNNAATKDIDTLFAESVFWLRHWP